MNQTIDLSFSRVQTYERCPWMYHLVYDLNWRAGPTAPMAMGQSLHKTAAQFLSDSHKDKSLDSLYELFDQEWVNEGFKTPQETLEAYEKGRAMLKLFHEKAQPLTEDQIQTEREFNVELDGKFAFRGTIDRLDIHPNGEFDVVEYKTQKEAWTPQRMQDDLQLTFYALGAQKLLGRPVSRLRYYFFSTGDTFTTTRSDVQLENALTLLKNVGGALLEKKYTPKTSYCSRCEFGKRCEFYVAS